MAATVVESSTEIDVSIVLPCLNEAQWLPACIDNAKDALEAMRRCLGFSGEIIIADNGSTDDSRSVAHAQGVRVVDVEQRGYGAALMGGLSAANGTYIVMGDADGSYDLRESVAMIRALAEGADLCMGSRFKGRIQRGAMPWMNRYIGNPILTFTLNCLFGAGISDAHCGLRALTQKAFRQLNLAAHGMEFASEMIVKATLNELKITEVPTTLLRDLRDRPPHLRRWKDGWRHLRCLLMLKVCSNRLGDAAPVRLELRDPQPYSRPFD
jgi:glycosyltransferase involved in cell wall biosynthesis